MFVDSCRYSNMQHISFTLVADGTSDQALLPIIEWVVADALPGIPFRVEMACKIGKHADGLSGRISNAIKLFPCDILIVHRDAEGESLAHRTSEIDQAIPKDAPAVVKVIPTRMTEAWLMGSEVAIRTAAGNPNGKAVFSLPKKGRWELEKDPKEILFVALRFASELKGRRLKSFDVEYRRHRVSQLIDDFSYLRGLSSFDEFERSLRCAIRGLCVTGA